MKTGTSIIKGKKGMLVWLENGATLMRWWQSEHQTTDQVEMPHLIMQCKKMMINKLWQHMFLHLQRSSSL